ncbi:UNVERIFIED_CONTAM: hypothetical protein Slati_1461500 [Sesamum latifolium]|uniref:Uncharacterized protein n=1 Tax=Sesamum latifolium TaxID=2727402 RepID=A0AAW2XA52_9LAMI
MATSSPHGKHGKLRQEVVRLNVRHPLPSVLLAAASLPFHQVLCVFALGSACNSVIEDRFNHLLLRLRQFKLWAAGLIAVDTPTVSRRQTRYAKARVDKEAALNVPSRFSFPNDENENPSVNSTYLLDLKKFTSDLLAQTQQPELPFEATPPCSDEIMVDNDKLPETDANVDSNSEHPTRPSIPKVVVQVENPFVDGDGYKVKSENVPLLKAIFAKYGDIAKHSTFSVESCSCLLELVFSIYKRLEASKLAQLTPLELQSMLGQIGDLELVKVEVRWLHHRLNQISKARQLFEGVWTFKDAKQEPY